MFEETTGTLLCGNLFTRRGRAPAGVHADRLASTYEGVASTS